MFRGLRWVVAELLSTVSPELFQVTTEAPMTTENPTQFLVPTLKYLGSAVAGASTSDSWSLVLGAWAPIVPWKSVLDLLSVTTHGVTQLALSVGSVSLLGLLAAGYCIVFCLPDAREALRAQLACRAVRLNRFGLLVIAMAFVSLNVPYAAASITLMLALTKLRVSATVVKVTAAGLLTMAIPTIALYWIEVVKVVCFEQLWKLSGWISTFIYSRRSARRRLRIVDGSVQSYFRVWSQAA